MHLPKKNNLVRPSLLAALAMASLSVNAGPPIPFDGYTVNSGDITAAPCPSYATCSSLTDPETVVSDGMLQRRVTISGTGDPTLDGTYIQFIITDPGVTGDASANPFSATRGNLLFTNEDFVKMHNRSAGISEKQTIIQSEFVNPDLENRFVNITEYEYGPWANSGANYPWVHVDQQISQVDYTKYNATIDPNPTLVFDSSAVLDSNGNGFTDNFKIDLSQMVDMTDAAGFGAQGFKYVDAKGQYLTSGAVTLPDGSNISWNPLNGDEVSAMWIGQSLAGGGSSPEFGHTKYTKVDTSNPFNPVTTSIDWTSFASAIAQSWNQVPPNNVDPAVFGSTPTLPTGPTLVAATASISPPDPINPNPSLTGSPPAGSTTPVAPPVPYYSWTVTNGVFTLAACPVGATCGAPIVNEGGLMQRIVTKGGVDYIQTIVTDPNATGDPNATDFAANSLAFKSENFVRMGSMGGGGGIGSGIASQLHIAEQDTSYITQTPGTLPTTGGQFTYDTALKTGWANGGPTDPKIAVSQRIMVPDTSFPDVSSSDYTFTLKQGQADTDKMWALSDVVGTVTGGNGFQNPIMFNTIFRSGAFQNTSHALTDPALLPSTGGNIAWNPGEAIQVTWVAGEYVTPDPFGPSAVNTLSYTNLSTGDRTASTSRATPVTGPESWVDPFGPPTGPAAPTYTTTYTPPPF